MIDVFVVSIFLSYLGFGAFLKRELEHGFQSAQAYHPVLNTSMTHLEPGFYCFSLFVVGSIFLSLLLSHYGKGNSTDIKLKPEDT